MTSAAAIPLDQSDIAYLEARNPREAIDELIARGTFVIVDEQEKNGGVCNGSSNSKKQ